jgi:hypothetical protein
MGVAVGVTAFLLAATYLIDPYDSGRSSVFAKQGVRPQGPRTAAASRGRDPRFEGAIFGNSHTQLLSPERLSGETQIPFVQLTAPATGPKEQFVLIDWFMRHHPGRARALIIGIDTLWCTADPELRNTQPFPFWLFGENTLDYVKGLLRWDALDELPRRLTFVFSRNPTRARPDGYWDYEPYYVEQGFARPEALARLAAIGTPTTSANPGPRFPAAEKLETVLKNLPPELSVILYFPPAYARTLPPDGTAGAAAEQACKAAFVKASQAHARTRIVDWRVDRPETRATEMFFDQSHYRHPLARMVENDIIAALLRDRGSIGDVTKLQ